MTGVPDRAAVRPGRSSASSRGRCSIPRRSAGTRSTERVYCGGEGGQIYAVTLDGSDRARSRTPAAACSAWRSTPPAASTRATGTARKSCASIPPRARSRPTRQGAPELPIDDPNSPVFADDGTMYVTGSENPAIFRVAPGGETTRVDDRGRRLPERHHAHARRPARWSSRSRTQRTSRADACGASRSSPTARPARQG